MITNNISRGISTLYGSSTITENTVTGHGVVGIWDQGATSAIKDNIVRGNYKGVQTMYSSPAISENNITGNSWIGISVYMSSATLYRNTITGNGIINIESHADIWSSSDGATSAISFNVFDTKDIYGDPHLVGLYNATSDGSPISIP